LPSCEHGFEEAVVNPPKTSYPGTAGQARKRILEAATKLFARRGYGSTGVREIAAEAGANVAAISYHFGSKPALLEEIITGFFEDYSRLVHFAVDTGDPIEQRLRQFVRSVVKLFQENPERMRVALLELPYDQPEITSVKIERVRALVDLFRSKMLSQLPVDQVQAVPLHVLGPSLLGMITFHILNRDLLAAIFGLELDERYYAELPESLTDLFLHGAHGFLERAHQSEQEP